jgi:hypothetical protein
VDELVELLPSLTDAVDSLLHFADLDEPFALVLFVELEKLSDFCAILHVEFGRGFVELFLATGEHFDHGLDGGYVLLLFGGDMGLFQFV